MILKYVKSAYMGIRKNLGSYFRIALIDIAFMLTFAAIAILFAGEIAESATMVALSISGSPGADAAESIARGGDEALRLAEGTLRLIVLSAISLFVLYTAFSGTTSYLIARRIARKLPFGGYMRRYILVSIALFAFLIAFVLLLSNTIYSLAISGIYSFHYFLFILFASVLAAALFYFSVAYSMIPFAKKRLFREAFRNSFRNPGKTLPSFAMLLVIFLGMVLLIKYALAKDAILGLFLLLLLLFPYAIFGRALMIETVKERK